MERVIAVSGHRAGDSGGQETDVDFIAVAVVDPGATLFVACVDGVTAVEAIDAGDVCGARFDGDGVDGFGWEGSEVAVGGGAA